MKIHHSRYVLLLLVFILFAVTLVVYSQQDTAESNNERNSPEQSAEQSPSLEIQDITLENERQSSDPEAPPAASQEFLKQPFQIYAMIWVFIGSILAIAIFFAVRKVGQLGDKVEVTEGRLAQRIQNSDQRWDELLKHIKQQGMDSTQKLEEMVAYHAANRELQGNLGNALSELGDRVAGLELALTEMGAESTLDRTVDVKEIMQEAQARVESLAQIYENGERIDIVEMVDPTPSQNTLMILDWIAHIIEDWISKLEQSGTRNPDFIQTLEFAIQDIKAKLKEARGPAPPLPEPLNPDTEVNTDTAYNELKLKYSAYVSRYEGLLVGYQLGRQIDETEYNQFIPYFIKDRLFNGVARFISVEQLPDQLDELLQFVGYEVVRIEIGRTKADARLHDIQSSRQTDAEYGTIVEVVVPGLQRKADGEIVQKPVVIRGE